MAQNTFLSDSAWIVCWVVGRVKIYGDKVDPIVALISDAIVKGELRGILPDSDEAAAVQAEVTKQIGIELAKLKANSKQAPTKGGKKWKELRLWLVCLWV